MKRKLLTILFLFTTAAYAQDSKHLSLDEAIDLSVKNNKHLKLGDAKVDEATAVLRETRNNMLPDLKASGAFLQINNPDIDLKVKLGGSSSDSSGSKGASSLKVNQVMYGIVSASIPLFSGFKIHYGIESAKYLQQAAKLDAGNDKDAVIQNTIEAYNNLYKAAKAIELVNQNLKQSQQRVKDFTNLEKNGIIARNDLLKVELQESNVELALLDAENNLKIVNINMNLMLGLPEGTLLIPDSIALDQNLASKTISDWEMLALQNRKDMAAIDLRKKAATSGIKLAQGDYYPGIALTGGYIALNIPNFLTVTNALNVGVGLQYNLGSIWKAGAKVAQAKAQVREVEISEELLSDQIKVQINTAYQNFILSQKKIDVYAKALDQATENYRITKNKYDNNLATTTDLLEADVAQLQAQLNYAYSKGDAAVSYKKLLQTAGILNSK